MRLAPARWARRNLFASPLDAALSVMIIPALAWSAYGILRWALTEARWRVLTDSMRVLMVGVYPPEADWRAWTATVFLSALLGASFGLVARLGPAAVAAAAFIALLACAAMLAGGARADAAWAAAMVAAFAACWLATDRIPRLRRWLPAAALLAGGGALATYAWPGTNLWGGLLLSVVLTVVTSLLTLPLGILLAFGRRSRYASLRICCTAYVEAIRAVPLILIVYWIWIVVPLLMPDASVSSVLRGVMGYAIFFSAYVAEYVRSGLQAVPRGQFEAARSLGLGGWAINTRIVLPQAIKVVVPALVGNVLDIFNAATLVFIIGLTDFLRAGQTILADPRSAEATYEVYAFMFLVYFAIASMTTYASRSLERRLAGGR